MTASQLVPGIDRYPELAKQLEQRLDMVGSSRGGCSACATRKLAGDFRRRMNVLIERERLVKGRNR